jgi:hypothetical protein
VIDGNLWGVTRDERGGKRIRDKVQILDVNSATLHQVPIIRSHNSRQSAPNRWRGVFGISYFTDGNRVLWGENIVNNLAELPPVDVQSFQQSAVSNSLAVDKDSIYWAGNRVDSNQGLQKIRLETLTDLGNDLLSDGSSLYQSGVYQGSANGLKMIDQKVSQGGCTTVTDTILSSDAGVFDNGKKINDADSASFSIERWIPNRVLDYKDKRGLHLDKRTYIDEEFKRASEFIKEGEFFFGRRATYYVPKERTQTEKNNAKGMVFIKGLSPQLAEKNARFRGPRDYYYTDFITHIDNKTWYVLRKMDTQYKLEIIKLKNDQARVLERSFNSLVMLDNQTLYVVGKFPDRMKKFKIIGQYKTTGWYSGEDDVYQYNLDKGTRVPKNNEVLSN